jgi:hypothetical protein
MGMARFSTEDREPIWDMQEAGVPVKRIAKHLSRQNSSPRRFIADHVLGMHLNAPIIAGVGW